MRPPSKAFLYTLFRDERLPVEESATEIATILGRAAAILKATDDAFRRAGPDDLNTDVWLGSTATILAELHALATDDDEAPTRVPGGAGG